MRQATYSGELYTFWKQAPCMLLVLGRIRETDHLIPSVHAAGTAHHNFCQTPNNDQKERRLYIWDQLRAEPESYNKLHGRWPRLLCHPPLLHWYFSPTLYLWLPWGEGKIWIDLWVSKISIWLKPKVDYCCTSWVQLHLGMSLKDGDEGNSS